MATMTRAHFELIARAIRDAKPIRLDDHDPKLIPWTNCAIQLSRELAETNARFDRSRFLDACGVIPANRPARG